MDKEKKLEFYLRKFTSEDFSKEDYYSEYTSCLLQNLKEKVNNNAKNYKGIYSEFNSEFNNEDYPF